MISRNEVPPDTVRRLFSTMPSLPSGQTSTKNTSASRSLPAVRNGSPTVLNCLQISKALPKVEVLRTYSNVFLEYILMNEYAIFRKKFIPGVYIMPSFESALKWFVVFFVRAGVFEGGAFRALLEFSPLHPDGDVPTIMFDPPVFHPLVSPLTGKMDISCKIDKWKRDEHHVYHVIEAVKSLLEEVPEEAKPSNREASRLYRNNIDEFKRVAEDCVIQCLEHLQRESPSPSFAGGISSDPNCFDFVAHDTHDLSLSLDEASLFSLRLDSSDCSNDLTKCSQRLQGLSWVRDGKPWSKDS